MVHAVGVEKVMARVQARAVLIVVWVQATPVCVGLLLLDKGLQG